MSVESMTSVLEGHIDQGEARDRQWTYHNPECLHGQGTKREDAHVVGNEEHRRGERASPWACVR